MAAPQNACLYCKKETRQSGPRFADRGVSSTVFQIMGILTDRGDEKNNKKWEKWWVYVYIYTNHLR
jgi:hypothetical protein